MKNDDFTQPPTRVDDAATRRRLSGPGRVAATFLLALGLTAVGGVAIVNAASPDPSASPSQTSGTSGGSTTTPSGDCPNM
jgi:hypothetical protein